MSNEGEIHVLGFYEEKASHHACMSKQMDTSIICLESGQTLSQVRDR